MPPISNNDADARFAAESSYVKFKTIDPFPSIESALLSAADITDYAQKVGLIFPFDKKNLKPATYALVAGGPYMYWLDGVKYEGFLRKDEYITIKKDSILYISLEPIIQLPNYIAARFNLTINHVYRGLLLGTGPMVDPGFVGRISMPLHNFTSNDYQVKGGESLVRIEFTKLAKNPSWTQTGNELLRKGEIVKFDEKKNNRKLADYVYSADKRPIESSTPLSITKAEHLVKVAQESVKSSENIVKLIFGINLALIVAVLTFVWNVYGSTRAFYNDAQEELYKRLEKEMESKSKKLDQLEDKIDSLKIEINKVKR